MRQVVLDTETTGLSYKEGHRVIEIGGVEMIDRRITNNYFHEYINPEREVEDEALQVHGITNEFLQDKPLFTDVAAAFADFVKGAELVIHNAPFDMGFLNFELTRCMPDLGELENHCAIFDTLVLARRLFPGQRNSLDALCKRYGVDNADRQLHGALLDAKILAQVYLVMTGGQTALFGDSLVDSVDHETIKTVKSKKARGSTPVLKVTDEELRLHENFLEKLLANGADKSHWD